MGQFSVTIYRATGSVLSDNQQHTETRGGELLVSDLGPRLWGGSVVIAVDTHAKQRQAQALATALREGGASFLIGDPKGKQPINDQDGSFLVGTGGYLQQFTVGSGDIQLTAVREGHVIAPGDYIAFRYGPNNEKYALHQVIVGGTADVIGDVNLTVAPRIRAGVEQYAEVSLQNCVCKAVMVPGSFKSGTIGLASTSGYAFSFRQVLT